MGIIYVLTNKINGKKYVGQTVRTFNDRLSQHLSIAKKEKPKMVVSRAIKKYGIENFDIETHDIINCCLDDTEKVMVKTLNSKIPNGYNVIDGGKGNYGFHHTEEAKKKISMSLSGKNSYMYGKQLTEEVKQKISKARIGKHHTEKTKKKLTKSLCKYTYEVTTPNGDKEIINNMNRYCNDNNIDQSAMQRVAMGKYKQHKGYTARILNELKKEN